MGSWKGNLDPRRRAFTSHSRSRPLVLAIPHTKQYYCPKCKVELKEIPPHQGYRCPKCGGVFGSETLGAGSCLFYLEPKKQEE
jgi:transposase-like protein